MNNIPKSILLRQRLTECKGYYLLNRTNQFYLTNYIFNKNYDELLDLINKQTEPSYSAKLMKYENRQELESLQFETIRLLHNYIISAISLIDHTRVYINEVYKENNIFLEEYNVKTGATFANNPLSVFIKCLRQYIQHYQTPIIATITNLTDIEKDLKTKIVISKKNLLDFSGWKALAKTFIDNIDDYLDVKSAIEQYHTLVKDFYSWFEKRQTEMHKKEFEEMRQINIKMLDSQIEELIFTFIKSSHLNVENFTKELARYMSELESKVFLAARKEGQLMYIFSIIQHKNIKLTKGERNKLTEKYSR